MLIIHVNSIYIQNSLAKIFKGETTVSRTELDQKLYWIAKAFIYYGLSKSEVYSEGYSDIYSNCFNDSKSDYFSDSDDYIHTVTVNYPQNDLWQRLLFYFDGWVYKW